MNSVLREMMTGKIHRAKVTQADLHYIGSITIDAELLDAAGILENEKVSVVDINNGSRLETYALRGAPGSGVICLNGAAARLVSPGDLVIIMAYGLMDDAEARTHVPNVVHVDSENKIVALGSDAGQPVPGASEQKASR